MDKRRLTRLVRTPEDVVLVDPTGKQNGRGAYICDQPACWEKLLRNRSILNQALKTAVCDEDMATLATHKPAERKSNIGDTDNPEQNVPQS
jgi:uncharacterized protein